MVRLTQEGRAPLRASSKGLTARTRKGSAPCQAKRSMAMPCQSGDLVASCRREQRSVRVLATRLGRPLHLFPFVRGAQVTCVRCGGSGRHVCMYVCVYGRRVSAVKEGRRSYSVSFRRRDALHRAMTYRLRAGGLRRARVGCWRVCCSHGLCSWILSWYETRRGGISGQVGGFCHDGSAGGSSCNPCCARA